jgi:hypothetical protein
LPTKIIVGTYIAFEDLEELGLVAGVDVVDVPLAGLADLNFGRLTAEPAGARTVDRASACRQ